MKKISILLCALASLNAGAQNVKLNTGAQITGNTKTTIDMDMGIGGQMKMESSATSVIHITGMDDLSYKADNTITKLKISEDGGGQNMSYDSENPADTASEQGREFGKTLNQPVAVLIDKTTGVVKDASPEKPVADDNDNPFAGLLQGSKSPGEAAAAAFFVLPAEIKPGYKWTDTTEENSLKSEKNYEVRSIKDGIAVIVVNAVTKGSIAKETQGMAFTISLSGTSATTMTTNTLTGLVQKTTTVGNMAGTMDIMGQSVPISMTINSEAVFE